MYYMINFYIFIACMCDPISPTSDCKEYMCRPFLDAFFVLHLMVLVSLITFLSVIELRGLQKYYIWRFILAFGVIAEIGMLLFNRSHTLLYTHFIPLLFQKQNLLEQVCC